MNSIATIDDAIAMLEQCPSIAQGKLPDSLSIATALGGEKLGWYPRYPSRFNSSNAVDAFDNDQYAWYARLIDRSWDADSPCFLPNETAKLAAWCRCTPLDLNGKGVDVLERFERTEDGKYLYHPVLLAFYITNLDKWRREVSRSKKGAAARWNKTPEHMPKDMPKHMPKQSSSNANKNYNQEEPSTAAGTDELIFNIAKAYPKLSTIKNEMEIPQAVATLIVAAVHEDGGDKVLAATKAYAASLDHPKFAAKPEDFFGKPYQYRAHIPQPKKPCLGPDEIMDRQLRGIYD